jgi:hypothetical protein
MTGVVVPTATSNTISSVYHFNNCSKLLNGLGILQVHQLPEHWLVAVALVVLF